MKVKKSTKQLLVLGGIAGLLYWWWKRPKTSVSVRIDTDSMKVMS